jgi:transcriptional regulator with XRE-family HTH domain
MNKRFNTDLQRRLADSEFAEGFGAELAKSEIAVALTRARLTCDVTQVDLANKLGTNQSYIAKLERGDANPTIGVIGKVLALMGLRLKVHAEPILHDITPHVVTSREGRNDWWNVIWSPYGIDVTATSKTETREEMVAVGGYR